MRRYEDNYPLLEEQQQEQQNQEKRYNWNLFKNEPREVVSGSLEQYKYVELGIKVLKITSVILTFVVVLFSAAISKGSLLFMTSQIQPSIHRNYCSKHLDPRQQYLVEHPIEERTVWIWLIIFAYFVPELGTAIRSIRILCFKTWTYPKSKFDIFIMSLTEFLPTIGSCMLVFIVLPELDVVKGAMLTNGVCLIPGLLALITLKKSDDDRNDREEDEKRRTWRRVFSIVYGVFDFLAIFFQTTALVAWPLVERRPVLYAIPVSLLLISFGWWENYISVNTKFPFLQARAKEKAEFRNEQYFVYAFLAPLKCLIFFITTLIIFWIREGNVSFLFDHFSDAFSDHFYNVTQIKSVVGSDNVSYDTALSNLFTVEMKTSSWTPLAVWFINILATYFCYIFSKFSWKIMIQTLSFAIPINLAVPALLTGLISMSGMYNQDSCAYDGYIPLYLFFTTSPVQKLNEFLGKEYAWIWLVWLLSQTWITLHIWQDEDKKLLPTEQIFYKPMYDAYLIDQSVTMNKRRHKKSVENPMDRHDFEDLEDYKGKYPKIYACGTMWHETKEEMIEFLKSVLRMDEDHCAHRIIRTYLELNLKDYYEFETHIFFDDAFIRTSQDDPDPHVNSFVLDLIESVGEAAKQVHAVNVRIKSPTIYPTPYGGRLTWELPGKTKMIAHLKDKAKIRPKKRWSQVMYMYYLLGYKIMDNEDLKPEEIKNIAKNTYILALDGDIDFQPQAVHLLVDYMKKNEHLGAACGRIHPVGSGAMTWYQIFEYAVGHWLQKATEHVIGCVLCSPGCFSLFRASALMDDNVMAKYTTEPSEAVHYVQYDQGEDRWLCTLLLQRGYRVEYSAASDAYTHCPEGFNEFYNQRRRWMPSTTANILDLLGDYKHILKVNDNISILYIIYQVVLMVGTVIGPGTIFIMLVGAFVSAFKISQYTSMWWNLAPVLLFVITCATTKSDTQLFFAGLISAIYGLVMMTVVIGILIQVQDDGWLAPSSLFLVGTAGEFIIAAIVHPQEFYCLKYGLVYYITVPSMYMILVIYSIFNMNNVSWGTREVTVQPKPAQGKENANQPKKEEPKPPEPHPIIKFFSSLWGSSSAEREILRNVQESLRRLELKLNNMQNNGEDEETTPRRRTTRNIQLYHGQKASRADVDFVENLSPNEEDDEEEDEDSTITDVPENSWFYDGKLKESNVNYLERREEIFFEKFIEKYLYPLDETSKKEKVAKELKDLRDRSVVTFFLLNTLFVLIIFLLNLNQDVIHINWPVAPKVNFTYTTDTNEIIVQETYLQLQPIGFVFLIAFAGLMSVQFVAMFVHRFGTFCQVMSNTNISILGARKIENVTKDHLLDGDPVKLFKKLIRLEGINDDDGEKYAPASANIAAVRRNTVYYAAMKRTAKVKPLIEDLDSAFNKRMQQIEKGKSKELPRHTLNRILDRRRKTEFRRMSRMPKIPEDRISLKFDNIEEESGV